MAVEWSDEWFENSSAYCRPRWSLAGWKTPPKAALLTQSQQDVHQAAQEWPPSAPSAALEMCHDRDKQQTSRWRLGRKQHPQLPVALRAATVVGGLAIRLDRGAQEPYSSPKMGFSVSVSLLILRFLSFLFLLIYILPQMRTLRGVSNIFYGIENSSCVIMGYLSAQYLSPTSIPDTLIF